MDIRLAMRFLTMVVLMMFTAPATGASAQAIAFKVLAKGNTSGIHQADRVVVRTPSAWRALWRRHTSGLAQPRPMPAVDFRRETLIAVFAGKGEPGTRVSILRIIRGQTRLTVVYRISAGPGPSPIAPDNSTPFHIVRLPRSTMQVVFRRAAEKDVFE